VDETGRAGCIRDKELYQNAARVLKEQGLDLNTAIEEFLKGIVKK
jgi:antitoxin component of RelBE/YafQ-DinJ toxin-antitoxin module